MCTCICHSIYIGFMIALLVLTAIALFTRGWSELDYGLIDDRHDHDQGLMSWTCVRWLSNDYCERWWETSPHWRRAVAVMMCLALSLEIFAVVWSIFAWFTFCIQKYLIRPLLPLTLIIFLLLLVSVIVYAANNDDVFRWYGQLDENNLSLGWSFWVAVAATILAGINVFFSGIVICFARDGDKY